ncbi:MAG: hypothetical protein IJY39_14095 [Clostridia bacterium]|nr:hypothetical protein [Clostridia bacterium]
MKTYVKVLSVLLTILMLLPCFTACDGSEDDTTASGESATVGTEAPATEASETETEYAPDVAKTDYNAEFYLSVQPDSNYFEYHWVEESDNDALSQAIYNRQQLVEEYLGVKIVGTKVGTSKTYIDPFKIAVKNKDGSVDTVLTHHYHGIDAFISGNYVADYNDYTQINLNADYWNRDIMEAVEISGSMFLGKSDFNILCTYVILFNKEMMDKYDDAMEQSVYEMVDNYTWTLDRMISLANLVYVDETGNGQTIDDTFGIIGEQDAAVCGFLLAGNVSMISPNEEGDYVLSVFNEINKEKTTAIVEKLHELSKSDSAWFWPWASPDAVDFQSGRSLMILSNTNRLPYYLNYDISFGVLPYPMYDEEQKDVGYRSLQFGGFTCIPSYVSNPEMVGDTLEVLSFFSKDVNVTFYEKLLGKQVADVPDDSRMLEIVWEGIGTDFAQTFYGAFIDTEIFHLMPKLTPENATQSVASFVAAKESSLNKKIEKFILSVEKLKK